MSNAFRRALDGWDEQHWKKGSGTDGDAVNIWERLAEVGARDDVFYRLRQTCREMHPDRGKCVTWFNDDPETTWSEMVALLEKAAIQWEGQVH